MMSVQEIDMSAELLNNTPVAGVDVEAEFQRLAEWWTRETGYLSSLTEAFKHPAYRAIVALGPVVVPVLLRQLEKDPDWWFGALNELTGANPIPLDHRGNLGAMAADWVAWGRTNGYSW
jgi:hypothetical protein